MWDWNPLENVKPSVFLSSLPSSPFSLSLSSLTLLWRGWKYIYMVFYAMQIRKSGSPWLGDVFDAECLKGLERCFIFISTWSSPLAIEYKNKTSLSLSLLFCCDTFLSIHLSHLGATRSYNCISSPTFLFSLTLHVVQLSTLISLAHHTLSLDIWVSAWR